MKSAITRLSILVLTLFIVNSLTAQQYVNIINVNATYYPTSSFKDSEAQTTVFKPYYNLRIPIVLENENVILLGTNGLILDGMTTLGMAENSDRLFANNVYAGYQHSFNDTWSAVVVGLMKVNSDFHNKLENDPYIPTGLFIVTYGWKENIDLKAGFYYGQEHFGAFTFPFFGVNWQINEKTYFSSTFPSTAELEYQLKKHKLYTGVRFQSQTESVRLSNDGDYVKYTEINLRAFLDAYITKNLTAYVGLGAASNRQYSSFMNGQKDEDEFLLLDPAVWKGRLETISPMIEVGLAFRVRLDAEEE